MAVTLKDIARRVGVSVTTVSRALGGYDDVAEETKRRILQAAQEMGYHPHIIAQSLQRQRTNTVGLIIPTAGPRFSDPYFTEILTGIGNEAAEHEFDLLVSTRAPGAQEREAYERIVGSRRVDGLLVIRTRCHDERITYLMESGFPFVAFGRSDLDLDFPYIDVDGTKGLDEATQYLIDLGHRRIAYISAPLDLMFAKYRLAGYKGTMERNGLSVREEWIAIGRLTQEDGYREGLKLLDLEPAPTAIIAANDLMALGAISAAQERGLIVGRDVAVTGFDDIPLAEHSHPALTTVRQPIYHIGTMICSMLIQVIHGEKLAERHILLEPTLVVRESSGVGRQATTDTLGSE
jgi:LacI family transcriptional regulator